MKKIDKAIHDAIINKRNFKCGFDEVRFTDLGRSSYDIVVYCHSNAIFGHRMNGDRSSFWFCTCGYDKRLTRDRLNACSEGEGVPVSFAIRKREMHWFLEGKDMGAFYRLGSDEIRAAYTGVSK